MEKEEQCRSSFLPSSFFLLHSVRRRALEFWRAELRRQPSGRRGRAGGPPAAGGAGGVMCDGPTGTLGVGLVSAAGPAGQGVSPAAPGWCALARSDDPLSIGVGGAARVRACLPPAAS